MTGAGRGEFLSGLTALRLGRTAPNLVRGAAREGRIVFVFPGQGPQWPGMAAALAERSPVFRAGLDECAQALEPFLDWPLHAAFRPESAVGAELDRADVAQPALFAVMVALAGLWRAHGVEPAAVVGHSLGEIAAAVVAGALPLEDGARIAARWSQAQATLAGQGDMVSVMAPEAEVERLLTRWEGRLVVAAVNSPTSVVVSGDGDAAAELLGLLRQEGVRARKVAVGLAAHSPHIDRIQPRLRADLADLRAQPPTVPFYSSFLGGALGGTRLDTDYWCRALRGTVRFADAVRACLADPCSLLVEVSPHPVVTAALDEICASAGVGTQAVGTLRRGDGGADRFHRSLAEVYAAGADPDWASVFPPTGQPIPLPAPIPAEPARGAVADGDDGTGRSPESDGTPRTDGSQDGGPQADGLRADGLGADGLGADGLRADGLGAELERLPAPARLGELVDLVRREVDWLGARQRPIGLDESLHEFGFDSVTAVEVGKRIGAALEFRLPVTALFDHPTPRRLAAHLAAELYGDGLSAEPGGPRARPEADDADDPVVIVGTGCRLPGGITDPEGLWRLLASGGDAVTAFPRDRGWDTAAAYADGRYYQREAGFLTEPDRFDAAFFRISPREALAMDPQQRLLLETTWEALERAGIDPTALRGTRTGVFVGAMAMEYGPDMDQASPAGGYLLTGRTGSVLSGRIAYTLGLEGPALTVDTACSSSLVALHLAAQSVRLGECELALVGGVTVMSTLGMLVEFSRLGALAPDGRCKAFSASADGFGLAEGVCSLVVERMSRARRSGHEILAVLRGSAVNQDGGSNGLTAPNGLAQQRVIRQALANARLSPAEVDAVEAHGTGTRLGDPIEAGALLATYGRDRTDHRPLLLGSVKSNLGHTQAAAGAVGVLKMILAMRDGTLPATLHVTEPSPEVGWAEDRMALLTEAVPWPETGRPRRAAVSSFGVSGTNAHVVLEQPPVSEPEPRRTPTDPPGEPSNASAPWQTPGKPLGGPEPARTPDEPPSGAEPAQTPDEPLGGAEPAGLPAGPEPARTPHTPPAEPAVIPWVLTARTAAALTGQAGRLLARVTGDPGVRPVDIGFSLAAHRTAFQHRAVVLGGARAELVSGLRQLAEGAPSPAVVTGVAAPNPQVAFVFPGQGTQWAGMGRELLASVPVFAERIAECDAALREHVDWSLLDVLRGADGAPGLDRVDVVQPVSFAVMVSLAAVWQSLGVRPAAVLGHSQGEIAAACVAGALTLADAARVVALRSSALRTLAGQGGMLSVLLPVEQVRDRIKGWAGRLSVAAVNGPSSTVVSGDTEAVAQALADWHRDGVRVRRIAVNYASHSAQMERLEAELAVSLAPVRPRTAEVPFHSSVTGRALAGTELDAGYWYRNLRQTVEFEAAAGSLARRGIGVFLEVSTHPVLAVGMQETIDEAGGAAVVLDTLRRDDGGLDRLLAAAAEAFTAGVPVAWETVLTGGRRTPLPTYAFDRQRYWLPDTAAAPGLDAAGVPPLDHPLLRAAVLLPQERGAVLTGRVRLGTHPWLADHRAWGRVLLPGAAFAELALAAGAGLGCRLVRELTLEEPLFLDEDGGVRLQVLVGPVDGAGARPVTVHSAPGAAADGSAWTQHASGLLATGEEAASPPGMAELAGAWPPDGADPVALEEFYPELDRSLGLGYGPAFRGLSAAWRRGGEIFAEVALPDGLEPDAERFQLHPALLDAALQSAALGGLLGPFRSASADRPPAPDEPHLTAEDEPRTGRTPATPPPAARTASAGQPTPPETARDQPRTGRPATTPAPTAGAASTDQPAPADGMHRTAEDEPPTEPPRAAPAAPRGAVAVVTDPAGLPGRGQGGATAAEPTRLPFAWTGITLSARGATALRVRIALEDTDTASIQLADPDGAPVAWVDSLLVRPATAARLGAGRGAGGAETLLRLDWAEHPLPAADWPAALALITGSDGTTVPGLPERAPVHASAQELAAAVRGGAPAPNVVLLTASRSASPSPSPPGADVVSEARRLTHAVLRDIARWSTDDALADARLVLLTRSAVHTGAGTDPAPDLAQAPLWGLVRAAQAENAGRLAVVDLDAATGPDALPAAIAAEVPQLAVRGGRGYVPRLRPVEPADDAAGVRADDSARATGIRADDLRADNAADAADVRTAHVRTTDAARAANVRATDAAPAADLRAADAADAPPTEAAAFRAAPLAAGTVLITGGTGGLGKELARHLVRRGARHLLLLSRSGEHAEGAEALRAELALAGAETGIRACDAADRDQLRAALAAIPAEHPLTVVIHAAGVLDDGLIQSLTPERVDAVWRPKVDAGWHLHELTEDTDLAAFVVFSSVSGVLGGAGQAGYASANVFLDALTQARRAAGRPGLSLAWGLWEDRTGMTGQVADADLDWVRRDGLTALSTAQGLALFDLAFDRALAAPGTVGDATLVAVGLDRTALRAVDPSRLPVPLAGLVPRARQAAPAPDRTDRTEATDRAATRVRPRSRETVLALLRDRVGSMLGYPAGRLDGATPLVDLGMDSVTAMRARAMVESDLGVNLPVARLLGGASLDEVADQVLAKSPRGTAEGRPGRQDAGSAAQETAGAAAGAAAGEAAGKSAGHPAADPGGAVVLRPATRDVLRLLRAEQQGTPGVTHHIGYAIGLDAPTTRERLAEVLRGLAARHAALRTTVVSDPEHGARLRIQPAPPADLLRWSAVGDQVDVRQRLLDLLATPFDLAEGPLWRFELLAGPTGDQVLVYGAHHAVSDAPSLALVAAEIGAVLAGAEPDNAPTDQDIEDLLRAQPIEPADRDPMAAERREQFTGCSRLDLTLATPRPDTRSFRAGSRFADVPDELAERIARRAGRLGITPAAFWLGTLTVLLARLSGRRRFALAVPVDTRAQVGADRAIGFFGVPIPFAAEAAADEPIEAVLRRTDARLRGVLDRGASFVDVMSTLVRQGLHRANAPLIEVYFNYIRGGSRLERGHRFIPVGTGHSDLDLMVTVLSDLGYVRLDYNADIIDEAAAVRFGQDYLGLLAEAAENPEAPVTTPPSSPTGPPAVTATRPTAPVAAAPPSTTVAATAAPGAGIAGTPLDATGTPTVAAAPSTDPGTLAVAATFTLGNLPALLTSATRLPVAEAPYHQVLASVLDPAGVFTAPSVTAGVVLLRAVDFARFGPVTDQLLAQLAEEYPAAFGELSRRTGAPLIVGFPPSAGADDRMRRWERELAARLRVQPGVAVLDGDDWHRIARVEEPFDARTEAVAHLPFAPEFQAVVALTVAEVLTAVGRAAPKVIVVDGDDTLWGGVAGEIGPENVELTGPRAELAGRLAQWRAAGVLLALVSNNDEDTVRAVLDRPESVLRAEHFAALSAEWGPKPDRLAAVAERLRLGLDSFLFLDDNPVEVARMRSALPEVLCVTCPPEERLTGFVRRLWPVVPRPATREDAARAESYQQEQVRDRVRAELGFAEFLERLELAMDFRPLGADTTERSVQLSRRTNQFNLRPAPLDAEALARWQREGEVWTVSARDRFGDYGQIAVLVLRTDGAALEVAAWMMSCRVLGRGAEEHVLRWLAARAEALGATAVRLVAERTPRNIPARRLVSALGGGAVDDERLVVLAAPAELREFTSWAIGRAEGGEVGNG